MTAPGPAWKMPPQRLMLSPSDVHVWRASLEQLDAHVDALWLLLSPDERARAERFHFERDRCHYTVSRGVLRTILGGYLDVLPQELRFETSRYGKPSVAASPGEPPLSFNLSHSGSLVLYAITRGRAIGIDIERHRSGVEIEELAKNFFSEQERDALLALPVEKRRAAFFDCWTRKEAYIKAIGEGLSFPLDQFAVSLQPGEPARLLHHRAPQELARWSLLALAPGASYSAAVVVEGHDWRLEPWEWRAG